MQHVNSILDIAKFESGKPAIVQSTFHFGQFIQDIVDGQSGHAGRNQTTIEWEWLGPALEWVAADQAILEQILLNLVGNAIKFTHVGRISIEAEQIIPSDGGCNIELRIIDSGIGISDEDQIRIFDDFETCPDLVVPAVLYLIPMLSSASSIIDATILLLVFSFFFAAVVTIAEEDLHEFKTSSKAKQ